MKYDETQAELDRDLARGQVGTGGGVVPILNSSARLLKNEQLPSFCGGIPSRVQDLRIELVRPAAPAPASSSVLRLQAAMRCGQPRA